MPRGDLRKALSTRRRLSITRCGYVGPKRPTDRLRMGSTLVALEWMGRADGNKAPRAVENVEGLVVCRKGLEAVLACGRRKRTPGVEVKLQVVPGAPP